MSYNLKSLKGVMYEVISGSIIRAIRGGTRSLDCSLHSSTGSPPGLGSRD